jgi:bifunctional non-homologous end joining protein LigD
LTGLAFPEALPARRLGEAWAVDVDGREVRLSNLTKPYWPPDAGRAAITKGDLLTYYWNVADLVLPHLRDRPLTLHRMPDGLTGAPFYEKQVPKHAPDWLPTAAVPSESGQREVIDFVLAQDRASLLWVVNLGCIELHPLHSRVPGPGGARPAGALDRPDYAFFDLDPFEPYTFADVRAVAKLVKVVLDGLGLRGYPKTSGATGMQVFVPLDGSHTYADARAFVERVGELMARAWPEKVTMAWPIAERAGRVFVDHQMNRQGANIAGVYSVRPRPGAPVSTPLDWDELDEDIEPGDFTMGDVWERFASGDRFAGVLTDRQSLGPAMDALGLASSSPPPRRKAASGRSRWATPGAFGKASSAGQADLREYRRKRDFERTPEPAPEDPEPEAQAPDAPHPAGIEQAAPMEPGRRFVIQQHHARRLHHDVRFERDGVLVSFAVPKRLPEESGVRHLAVNTEDHPLDYLTFSGAIPSGEYGAGQVRLFDIGTYETVEARDGKLTVRLHGSRYQDAEYHLIRTRERDWICFLGGRQSLPQPAAPPAFTPMLATLSSAPFDSDDWLFEVKWDGHRCLATLGSGTGSGTGGTRLTSRTGRDVTTQFPELAELHRQLAARNAVVDGEVAALDERGRPSFERMQDRFHRSPEELRRDAGKIPVQFLAFDLLWLDGRSLVGEPLERRQALLAEVLVESKLVQLSQPVRGSGVEFFERARALGLEGVVAKRSGSTYQPGRRSAEWRKVKAVQRQDCVIVGWTDGQGGRSATLGALLVAVWTPDGLVFAGNVGTGFTHGLLERLMPELRARATARPPVIDPPRGGAGAHWVRPELVCEVEYLKWTSQGRLRAPSFKGIRTDKTVEDAVRE